MSKKILIISSSLRTNSNSEILAHQVEQGALDAGNSVEFLSLKDKNIQFCRGCLACQKTFKCVIKDDMAELVDKVKNADVLVFATPIYYYELSGQLKTFLDRCNPLFPQENKFKDVYLLTTSADEGKTAAMTATKGLEGWISCFEQSHLAGVLAGGDLTDPKEILSNESLLQQAYELGKNIK